MRSEIGVMMLQSLGPCWVVLHQIRMVWLQGGGEAKAEAYPRERTVVCWATGAVVGNSSASSASPCYCSKEEQDWTRMPTARAHRRELRHCRSPWALGGALAAVPPRVSAMNPGFGVVARAAAGNW